MLNEMNVTANFNRIELCDLMLACTAAWSLSEDGDGNRAEKWTKLHNKLKEMIDEFDRTQGY